MVRKVENKKVVRLRGKSHYAVRKEKGVIRLENVRVVILGANENLSDFRHLVKGKMVLTPIYGDEVIVNNKPMKIRSIPSIIRNAVIEINPENVKAAISDGKQVCISVGNDEYGYLACVDSSIINRLQR